MSTPIIEQNNNKELPWINNVKAICIFLVYYQHAHQSMNFDSFDELYEVFYVNAFFIISGYLIFKKQLSNPLQFLPLKNWWVSKGGGRDLLSNVFCKILLPVFFFSSLFSVPKFLLHNNLSGDNTWFFFVDQCLLGGAFWFISALLVAELVLVLLLSTRFQNIWLYVFLGAGCALLGGFIFPTISIWEISAGLVAVFFCVFGGLFISCERAIDNMIYRFKGGKTLFLASVLLYIIILSKFDFDTTVYNGISIGGILISFFGSIILIEFAKWLPNSKTMNFIGRHTLGLYFFCGILPKIFTEAAKKFLVVNTDYYIIVALISLVTAIMIVSIIDKICPWVFNFRLLWKSNKR